MDRRILLLAVGLVAMLAVVNATVFTYRWLTGTVLVYGPEAAAVHGCVGFYSTADQPGLRAYLPEVGTNLNAPILGTGASISVTPGDIVCLIPSTTQTYKLYESISATFNVTVGSWYIQDFYGFGYYAESTDAPDPVYVWLKVEETDLYLVATSASLIVYRNTSNGWEWAGSVNLRELGALSRPISLPVNGSLRLDLYIDAFTNGTRTFKVGFYVTPESGEPPIIRP